jgi:hypothetical protein
MPSERRGNRRIALDVQLDDLQSEQEACERTLNKLQSDAGELDLLLETQLQHAAVTGRLVRRLVELKRSTAEQRAMLSELRATMATFRRALLESGKVGGR